MKLSKCVRLFEIVNHKLVIVEQAGLYYLLDIYVNLLSGLWSGVCHGHWTSCSALLDW